MESAPNALSVGFGFFYFIFTMIADDCIVTMVTTRKPLFENFVKC